MSTTENETTLYLSGSITDGGTLHGEAVARRLAEFHEAEARLVAAGYDVLNPARNEGKADDWLGYMRLALRDISRADGVAFLGGWEKSRGAVIEVGLGRSLGLLAAPVQSWIGADR